MLKANGKFIDTLPLQQLLSQEESRVDTVAIEVDRYYGTHDLADFLFVMRGVTPSGGETEAALTKTVGDDTITLSWEIGPKFTQEPGRLALDLFAYRYEEEADPEEDPPDYLLRYQLPAVQVRPLPDSSHVLDEQSYTAFLLEVRNTAEAALEEIGSETGAVHEQLSSMGTTLYALFLRVNAMTKIEILTQAAYDALEEKKASTLYVIRASE